ncbi:MAG TPA: MliC family protein [Candidatus Lustribacter sp.]|jgi:membrane-bound inhibitor of C-type lysozyme|nr:MliC family protein [Candidatus Lustribacter sp.]
MILRAFGFLAVLGLISSVTVASAQTAPPMPKKVTAFYMCNGLHFKAVYDNVQNRVSFVWGAKDYHLPHVVSADGARYANDKLEWWSKGSNATLYTVPEHTVLTTCTPGHRF